MQEEGGKASSKILFTSFLRVASNVVMKIFLIYEQESDIFAVFGGLAA